MGFWPARRHLPKCGADLLGVPAAASAGAASTETTAIALAAAAIATLDEASGRGAVLGLGAGGHGFPNIGLRFKRPVPTLRDAIQILHQLWSGRAVNYQGSVLMVRDASLVFPARRVPIYLAADAPGTLRLAGELADGVLLLHCASTELIAERLALISDGQQRRQTDVPLRIVARLDVSVARDHAAALHQAKVRLGRYLWARYPRLTYLDVHGLGLPDGTEDVLRRLGPFTRTSPPRTTSRATTSVHIVS